MPGAPPVPALNLAVVKTPTRPEGNLPHDKVILPSLRRHRRLQKKAEVPDAVRMAGLFSASLELCPSCPSVTSHCASDRSARAFLTLSCTYRSADKWSTQDPNRWLTKGVCIGANRTARIGNSLTSLCYHQGGQYRRQPRDGSRQGSKAVGATGCVADCGDEWTSLCPS